MRGILIVTLLLALTSPSRVLAQNDFNEWERRMLGGEHASAAVYAADIAERLPSSSVWAYRAGASLARAGDGDGAIDWLRVSAERGYSGVRTFETDADIDSVRKHAAFGGVIARVRANADKRMGAFREAAEEAEPVVVLPRGFDSSEPTPLVIALHGTGGTGREMARAWRGAARRVGAILVAPDALRPSGNGYAWVFRDESEWYVEKLIAEMREEYAIGEVVLVGFSQGANIALAMGRSHPGLFDAVVPVCGHWEADAAGLPEAPAEGEADDRPAWYLLIGDRDPWQATYDEAQEMLGEAGMRVSVEKVRELGHAMPRDRVLEGALRWCLE